MWQVAPVVGERPAVAGPPRARRGRAAGGGPSVSWRLDVYYSCGAYVDLFVALVLWWSPLCRHK